MDIIKNIMDISVNKRETLFVFLTDTLKYKYRYYDLKYFKDLYVNDFVHCIRRDTLDFEYKGRIKYIDDEIDIVYNGRNYYLDPSEYYFLNKEIKSTKNMRDFYKSLLNL